MTRERPRRSAPAPWYSGLRARSYGRARAGEKAARRRLWREGHRCGASSQGSAESVRWARRSSCKAKKAGRRLVCFAQLIPKLLNTRSQQSRVNLRVSGIHVAKVSGRKHDSFLVESLGRGNGGTLGGEKYSFSESRRHQVGQEGTTVPSLECGPAKIDVVDFDSLLDDVLCHAFQKRFPGLQFVERSSR